MNNRIDSLKLRKSRVNIIRSEAGIIAWPELILDMMPDKYVPTIFDAYSVFFKLIEEEKTS